MLKRLHRQLARCQQKPPSDGKSTHKFFPKILYNADCLDRRTLEAQGAYQSQTTAAPEVWEAIMPVAQSLIAKGVPVGSLTLEPEWAKALLAQGFTFVACGMDNALLARAADALLADLREHLAGT